MKNKLSNAFYIIAYILMTFLYVAFNYTFIIVPIIMVLLMYSLIVRIKCNYSIVFVITTIVNLFLSSLLICASSFSAKMIIISMECVAFIFQIIVDLIKYTKSKTGIITRIIVLFITIVLISFVIVTMLNPSYFIKMAREKSDLNISQEYFVEEKNDTYIFHSVVYESKYQNNNYTVYSKANNKGTLFFVHGGGFVIGDKEDPNQIDYFNKILDSGYNIVSVNYTLDSPNMVIDQLIEIKDAFEYFMKNKNDYYITNDGVILCGDSSGSMLSGMLALLYTNHTYTNRVGIDIRRELENNIKGYISISGLVNVKQFNQTGFFGKDWLYNICGMNMFNFFDYSKSEKCELSSILDNVNSSFPSSYISDGNFGTFYKQGNNLVSKLESWGIYVVSNVNDKTSSLLVHDFEFDLSNKYAIDNINNTINFIKYCFE